MRNPSAARFAAALACAVPLAAAPGVARAQTLATVSVAANRTGGFGSPNDGFADLISGLTLSAGQRVLITATGSVTSGAGNFGPDGTTNTVDGFNFGPNNYTALEEAAVDAGTLVLPRASGSTVNGVLALMGAFAPTTTASDPNFVARDADIAGVGFVGLQSSALFFVGTGLTFTAPTAGTLYFGVSDSFASNNSGAFAVTVSAAAPEPGSATLLAGGMLPLAAAVRRHRRGVTSRP